MDELRLRLGATAGRLLDLALPPQCAGCGDEGEPLCPACLPSLRVRADRGPGTPIGLASDIPAPLLQLEWCAPFAGVARRALHSLKYASELRLAEPLGAALADRWRRGGVGGDRLVHVPVHEGRVRERGFDQADRLARVAARELGLPHVPALERVRATTAQFRLDRVDRAANLVGAFRVRADLSPSVVRGHWIVLVDDVVTTGATLAGCATALLERGAIGVSALTVARER